MTSPFRQFRIVHSLVILAIFLSVGLLGACGKISLDGEDGAGSGGGGASSGTESYTVLTALSSAEPGTTIYVTGYIVGYIRGTSLSTAVFAVPEDGANTNMLLADSPTETDPTKVLPIKLTTTGSDMRGLLNLYDHPDYLHARIKILGYVSNYFRVNGIVDIFDYDILNPSSEEETGESGGGTGSGDNGEPGIDNDEGTVEGR